MLIHKKTIIFLIVRLEYTIYYTLNHPNGFHFMSRFIKKTWFIIVLVFNFLCNDNIQFFLYLYSLLMVLKYSGLLLTRVEKFPYSRQHGDHKVIIKH